MDGFGILLGDVVFDIVLVVLTMSMNFLVFFGVRVKVKNVRTFRVLDRRSYPKWPSGPSARRDKNRLKQAWGTSY